MAGEPLHLRIPQIWGVKLTGRLPEWVSAKDVILEMLRRHGVEGGFGRIIDKAIVTVARNSAAHVDTGTPYRRGDNVSRQQSDGDDRPTDEWRRGSAHDRDDVTGRRNAR